MIFFLRLGGDLGRVSASIMRVCKSRPAPLIVSLARYEMRVGPFGPTQSRYHFHFLL